MIGGKGQMTASRKLFVGSLPYGIQDSLLRQEFGKYGQIEDIFVKQGCEATRQWAFVTYSRPDEAQRAKDATDRLLQFPGCDRPCDVMVAKHQGMFGQDPVGAGYAGAGGDAWAGAPQSAGWDDASYGGASYMAPAAYSQSQYGMHYGGSSSYGNDSSASAKKIFVGSLPDSITEGDLKAEFGKYGQILDIFVNAKTVEAGRQWAFITFATADQASSAKVSTDRQLVFPGSEKACEVTIARHQGMFGKEPIAPERGSQSMQYHEACMHPPAKYSSAPASQGPRKIFVGSLPNNCTEGALTAEFSKYGQVIDVHINQKECEPGRNWAFITFASAEQATYAKDATDRVLTMPGADRACEVMLAKNQGKFGQDSLGGGPNHGSQGGYGAGGGYDMGMQPPPPVTPPPQHLTPWRMYKTAAGLPYYHNHATGVTTWECPPDFQVPGQPNPYLTPQVVGPPQARYSPY